MTEHRTEYYKNAVEMRKAWALSDAKRDADLPQINGVCSLENIVYQERIEMSGVVAKPIETWNLLDIYYPECCNAKNENNLSGSNDTDSKLENEVSYPVIVSIHGGGWFYGDKELYRPYTQYLASHGYAVVNFNYRLSPESVYPAGFEDVCAVFDFLIKHAEEYQLDMNNFFIVGDSAGAQLCSQYSMYATNADFRKLFSFGEAYETIVPNAIALNCGIYDMMKLYAVDQSLTDWYLPDEFSIKKIMQLPFSVLNDPQEEVDKEADVLHSFLYNSFFYNLFYVNESFPPTYLMCSVNDDLRIHTPPMKDLLEEKSIPLIYREFGQTNKKSGHVFHLDLRNEEGQLCNQEQLEFFESYKN